MIAPSALTKWLEKGQFHEGFQGDIFAQLAEKASKMIPEDRLVSLLIDEISLKEEGTYNSKEEKIFGVKKKSNRPVEHLSTALVLMAAGARARWRQALAFFFSEICALRRLRPSSGNAFPD